MLFSVSTYLCNNEILIDLVLGYEVMSQEDILTKSLTQTTSFECEPMVRDQN